MPEYYDFIYGCQRRLGTSGAPLSLKLADAGGGEDELPPAGENVALAGTTVAGVVLGGCAKPGDENSGVLKLAVRTAPVAGLDA